MTNENVNVDAEIKRQAIRNLADMVIEFYKDPANRQAYEAWKNSEEAKMYASYIS